jgi:hypothetical protein
MPGITLKVGEQTFEVKEIKDVESFKAALKKLSEVFQAATRAGKKLTEKELNDIDTIFSTFLNNTTDANTLRECLKAQTEFYDPKRGGRKFYDQEEESSKQQSSVDGVNLNVLQIATYYNLGETTKAVIKKAKSLESADRDQILSNKPTKHESSIGMVLEYSSALGNAVHAENSEAAVSLLGAGARMTGEKKVQDWKDFNETVGISYFRKSDEEVGKFVGVIKDYPYLDEMRESIGFDNLYRMWAMGSLVKRPEDKALHKQIQTNNTLVLYATIQMQKMQHLMIKDSSEEFKTQIEQLKAAINSKSNDQLAAGIKAAQFAMKQYIEKPENNTEENKRWLKIPSAVKEAIKRADPTQSNSLLKNIRNVFSKVPKFSVMTPNSSSGENKPLLPKQDSNKDISGPNY